MYMHGSVFYWCWALKKVIYYIIVWVMVIENIALIFCLWAWNGFEEFGKTVTAVISAVFYAVVIHKQNLFM